MKLEPQMLAYLARIANALERIADSVDALFVEEAQEEEEEADTAAQAETVRWT